MVRLPSNDSARDTALVWAGRGVPVFPVAIGKAQGKAGTTKRPLTRRGHLDAATTGPDVADLFDNPPTALRRGEVLGVGVVPGAAGFVVFDLDRHAEGPDGVAYGRDELALPTNTYATATGSGGVHVWLRKREPAHIGNASPWAEHGVDIRADDGWTVVDTPTPWGTWAPGGRAWSEGCALVPPALWTALVSGNGTARSTGSTWHRFDPGKHLPRLHPGVPALLEVLAAEGAQVLAFHERPDAEPYLDLSCDGRTTAATLGYVSPLGLNVFSSRWPGRKSGPQEVVRDPAPVTDVTPVPATLADELAADRLLSEEVATQQRRARAREILAEIKAARSPLPAPDVATLAQVLARPAEPSWRVHGLLPAGGRMLLTAIRKTGKTTTVGNLARSVLTGEAFLDRFEVRALTGSVVVLSYEMPERMLAHWWADIGVPTERCTVVNLRGRRNLLADEAGRAELVQVLRGAGAELLIVDTFARAFTGKSQNDAAEVARWLAELDEVAEAAGIAEVVVTAHAGWEGERTRGSTALEDWPEVVVTLTRAEDGQRFLRAMGRDVEVEEDALDYDEHTRTLRLAGTGSRRTVRAGHHLDELVEALVQVVKDNPGIGTNAIQTKWKEAGVPHSKGDGSKASQEAVARGLVVVEYGPNRTKMHRYPQVTPSDPDGPPVSDPKCLSIEGHSHRVTQTTSDPEVGSTEPDPRHPDPEMDRAIELLVDKLGAAVVEEVSP